MGSIFSAALPALQGVSKATQTEWNCPMCHSMHSNSDAMPCGHQFCLSCLLRHTATSPTCPLCTSPMLSARFSVLGQNDFLQCILSPPGLPLGPSSWARRGVFHLVHTSPQPSTVQEALSPTALGCAGPEAADGFPPDLWAELLLQGQEHLLDPVRPWLRQSLDAIYGPQWWEARQVESIALSALCICGPDREVLSYMLERYLREYTAPLIHGLIHVTMHQCRDAWRLRCSQAAQEEDESPAAAASPSTSLVGTLGPSQAPSPNSAEPGMEDQPSAPEPTHAGGPSRRTSVPVPVEQDHPQDVPEEESAAPGPSMPRRGRNCQPWVIQRSQRRRAPKVRRTLKSRRRKPKRK